MIHRKKFDHDSCYVSSLSIEGHWIFFPIFQGVEHVFLVGVAGAVPHYTDFEKHVRLGDVVMANPPKQGQRFIYQFCESVKEKSNGEIQFETKSWCPVDLAIQNIQSCLSDKFPDENPWIQHYKHGLEVLCEGKDIFYLIYRFSQLLGNFLPFCKTIIQILFFRTPAISKNFKRIVSSKDKSRRF